MLSQGARTFGKNGEVKSRRGESRSARSGAHPAASTSSAPTVSAGTWGPALLYGGRNSLLIGLISAAISTFLSIVLALLAAYFGGASDWIISRVFDLIWAFPVILLGIALGTALSINGFHHGPINIPAGSLWIPIAVISFVFIPYIGRPLRGQVLALRHREFIEASTAQGAGSLRIMFTELLPNIASSVLVLFTLIVANAILTEVGLSFLGAGVQPPNPSWGTMIADGQDVLASDPWLSLCRAS